MQAEHEYVTERGTHDSSGIIYHENHI